jgi:hypothetical protein
MTVKKKQLALRVVTQHRGPTPQPVGFLSKKFDQIAKGWPGCLRAVAIGKPFNP